MTPEEPRAAFEAVLGRIGALSLCTNRHKLEQQHWQAGSRIDRERECRSRL